jgi:D-alanine-D-alanine ligase
MSRSPSPQDFFSPLQIASPKDVRVLVLGGGPDAEREVSLESSKGVAAALEQEGYRVRREVIDRIDASTLSALGADVIFPVLHGPWGEGGPMQDELLATGKPFVGCSPACARLAMDKMATKLAAARVGVPTLPAGVLNLTDDVPPFGLPAVVKPIHEGSSVGVHICKTRERWDEAMIAVSTDRARHPLRTYMVERAALGGSELTVGWLDGTALPIVEIRASVEFYDYEAKYHRDDTQYIVAPDLPNGLTQRIQSYAFAVAKELGCRHLSRIDFMLDAQREPWLLEVNTLPGFTSHSLLPKAAAAVGINYSQLASRLVQMALRDR